MTAAADRPPFCCLERDQYGECGHARVTAAADAPSALLRAAAEALAGHPDAWDAYTDDARAVLAVVLPAVADRLRTANHTWDPADVVLDLLPEETPQGRPYPHHLDELR